MGLGEKVIMHKPNHRIRVSTVVSQLQLPHSPLPFRHWGCCPFFLGSPLWEPLASVAPGDLMPLSVFWFHIFSSHHFLRPVKKHPPLPGSSHQQVDRPQQQMQSCPSSAFQFARSSCCLGSEKGCDQVYSAHCTGNQCRSSSDSPPHSLHTQHSGPDPKSGAPCQFLMPLWRRLALRNLRCPKCPILGALVRGYWICQTCQYIYKPPIWIDFKFLHPL